MPTYTNIALRVLLFTLMFFGFNLAFIADRAEITPLFVAKSFLYALATGITVVVGSVYIQKYFAKKAEDSQAKS